MKWGAYTDLFKGMAFEGLEITEYLAVEGGVWQPMERPVKGVIPRSFTFHALKAADGRVWDEVNGWRPEVTKAKLDEAFMSGQRESLRKP